jgi:hypothetical protein
MVYDSLCVCYLWDVEHNYFSIWQVAVIVILNTSFDNTCRVGKMWEKGKEK